MQSWWSALSLDVYADTPVQLYLNVPSDLDPNCAPYASYEIVESDSVNYPVPTEYVAM